MDLLGKIINKDASVNSRYIGSGGKRLIGVEEDRHCLMLPSMRLAPR